MIICIQAKKIFRNGKFVSGEIWIQGGQVIAPAKSYDKLIRLNEHFITPGFIDLQVNGGFDIDLTNEPEKVEVLARKLLKTGVTAFLPTIISTNLYEKILPHLTPREVKKGARILGAHLEGPYLNPLFAGAHDRKYCLKPKNTIPLNNVKMMTLAPELPGAETLIQNLKMQGIIVAAGHSGAPFEMLKKNKIKIVTHLYNAMGAFHHRSPGLIEYALTEPKVHYTFIGDQIHTSKQALEIAYRAHPEGIILISDSSAHLCCSKERFKLGQRAFSNGALAGGKTPLCEMVKLFPGKIEDAVFSVTKRAALLLNLQKLGDIAPGYSADLNIFDNSFNLVQVCVRGAFLDVLSSELSEKQRKN